LTEPKAYLVIKPKVDTKELASFLADNGFEGKKVADISIPDGELPVVIGSRSCYQSFDVGREHVDHIRHLIGVEHGSTLEHSNYGILITGVSRSLTHELVRHRQFGVSQLSQRFIDHHLTNFVIPPALLNEWRLNPTGIEANTYRAECENTLESYKWWLATYQRLGYTGKEAKEAARSKLTNDVETRILITGDLRCWRVFFELRAAAGADKEIRRLANLCFDKLSAEVPNVLADYDKHSLEDGSFEVNTIHRKV
jgi:thymidylate synthase (FAD)